MMKLQRLNMDNSWMLEFSGLKILIDPWLQGKEIDFFPWFNTQWHRTKPVPPSEVGQFDLVIITQKYPDHFHPETLKILNPAHILCPASIQDELTKILPSAKIETFNKGLQAVLGSKVNIHFLPTKRKIDPIYDALIIENGEESIFIATHGFTDIQYYLPLMENLAAVSLLISPFDHYQLPFFLGGTVAPGIQGLKTLVQATKAKNVVATHDEDKHAKGLVQWFAKVKKAPSFAELNKDPILKNRILLIQDYQSLEI